MALTGECFGFRANNGKEAKAALSAKLLAFQRTGSFRHPFSPSRRRVNFSPPTLTSKHSLSFPLLHHPKASAVQMNQQHSHDNPLLHPPFFSIPGISPLAPISAQIQQVDQLNTLLLQEIDANFARFHQIITNRILPEIKRFAIGAEPVRETSQVRSVLLHMCMYAG